MARCEAEKGGGKCTCPKCPQCGYAKGSSACDAECRIAISDAGLDAMARASLANSKRWFPEVHERGDAATTVHLALGIGGEAGEVLDVIKKADICDGFMDACPMHADGKHSREALENELADLLTYVLALSAHLDVNLRSAWLRKLAECERRWGR